MTCTQATENPVPTTGCSTMILGASAHCDTASVSAFRGLVLIKRACSHGTRTAGSRPGTWPREVSWLP